MKVYVSPTPDEIGKFHGIVDAFPGIWTGRILDVGARSGLMKQALCTKASRSHLEYCSLDLLPPANVISNLEAGLPFADHSFEVVLALDVLEHTDDIYRAFSELCRASKNYVVVTLPNIYEIRGRLRFLRGRPTSGKYGLPVYPKRDRHRWVLSYREAEIFVHHHSQLSGFLVVADGCLIGPRRTAISLMVRHLANLLAPSYLALLARRDVPPVD